MKTAVLPRVLLSGASVAFAAAGAVCLFAPEVAAQKLGLEGLDRVGLATVRADLGGLFVGLAVSCGAAAATRSRAWLFAGGAVLAAIVTGRLLGWLASGGVVLDGKLLGIEMASLAALAAAVGGEGRFGGRWTWAAAGVGVAALAVAALFAPRIEQALFDRAAAAMATSTDDTLLADDALRVAVCGSSAPLPSTDRAKACVAVFAGGRFYVVDAGPESVENLVLWNVPLSAIGGVLLTHFHSDHIGDLGELNLQTWAGGRSAPLPVYGGPGVEQVVDGFNGAYTLDQGYRTTHHGEAVMPSAAWPMVAHRVELDGEPTPRLDRTGLVLDDGQLRITAIEVDHAPIAPAYAYRFDYRGRSVVVSGDLKDHAPLAVAARGADVLVSEAIATTLTRSLGNAARDAGRDNTAAIMHDIEDYHIGPEQAARIANEAGVELLVYYHLLPAPDGLLMRRLFSRGIDAVRKGRWTIADDGSLYTLPFGSDLVRVGRVGR
jgi:ribonuclease Z